MILRIYVLVIKERNKKNAGGKSRRVRNTETEGNLLVVMKTHCFWLSLKIGYNATKIFVIQKQ